MIKLIPVLSLIVPLFFSCKKEHNVQEHSEPTVPIETKSAIYDPNDINLNIDWKWYDPNEKEVNVYFRNIINGQPSEPERVYLPWYFTDNPINQTNRDYLPELGWTLYMKDFGTPDRPAQTPFFALYNKYSGILRFFVYNYRVIHNKNEGSKVYYVGELGFNNTPNYNELLSFLAPPALSNVQTIDPNLQQYCITHRGLSEIWINLDFILNISPHNYFKQDEIESQQKSLLFNLYGIRQMDIPFLNDAKAKKANSAIGILVNGNKRVSNRKKNEIFDYQKSFFIKNLNSSTKHLNYSTINAFSGTTNSSATTTEVIQSLHVSDASTPTYTYANLYSIQFNPNYTAALSPSYYVPIYKHPIGVFMFPRNNFMEIEQQMYLGCNSQKYTSYGGAFTTVRFTMADDLYDDLRTSLNGKEIRLDSVKAVLMNNWNVDSSANSFANLPQNFATFNHNTDSESDYFNKFETIYPVQTGENLGLGYLYFPALTRPYTDKADPKLPQYVGIEMKYSIIAPNYPDNSSRQRMIYKVFKVPKTFWSYDKIGGCPLPPSGI
ncbi:hypothetical protein [Olivibacter domesticus]|uniref:Lipoprotein n=1 Tax=Olivibacter domesticus TaxID=407022 RepID=A0A1H7Q1X2_OLID1|nr:hypothetical protein [Olivibacter domesticus]SEL41708.1 hypothetical protein SAMN05661044_02428 [Olivibacter domesticus]